MVIARRVEDPEVVGGLSHRARTNSRGRRSGDNTSHCLTKQLMPSRVSFQAGV